MTRGVLASVVLHVAVFAAALLGPKPKPFEWDPQVPHVVELVARAPSPPPERPVVPREAPRPKPPLDPPVKEPVKEVKPEEPKTEAVKAPEPTPVKPQPKAVRPPRQFQRVAPKKNDDGPSLAERLQERLESVTPPPDDAPAESEAEVADTTEPAMEDVDVKSPQDFPFAWYLRQVQTRVRDAWDTPGEQLLRGGSRPVTVSFVIHRDGRVSAVRVEAGSGSPGLDTSAVRAVEAARPFPPLPEPYEGDELALSIRFHVAGGGR